MVIGPGCPWLGPMRKFWRFCFLLRFVTERYILQQKCLTKWIGSAISDRAFPVVAAHTVCYVHTSVSVFRGRLKAFRHFFRRLTATFIEPSQWHLDRSFCILTVVSCEISSELVRAFLAVLVGLQYCALTYVSCVSVVGWRRHCNVHDAAKICHKEGLEYWGILLLYLIICFKICSVSASADYVMLFNPVLCHQWLPVPLFLPTDRRCVHHRLLYCSRAQCLCNLLPTKAGR